MNRMLLEIPSVLETDRLIIRQYRKGDGKSYFVLLQNNVEHLKEHVDDVINVHTENQAEIRIRELAAEWVGRTRFVPGIWEKASSAHIGQMWIEPKNWEVPLFELGWFLGKSYEGKGYATEAAKCCLTFLFEELEAHKVAVKVRESNERSFQVAERCGFVREGLLRDHVAVSGNSWLGLLCYGMLENEYEKLRPRQDEIKNE